MSTPTLHFHPAYRLHVLGGQKRTTVRWGESYTLGPVGLLFGDDPGEVPARIERIDLLPLSGLTDAHAQADGFADRTELLERLHFHYPTLPADAEVSVVHFALI